MTDKSLVSLQGRAVGAVSAANLPPAVSSGIFDLLAVFAAAQQEDSDKKRLLRIYGEAIAGFDAAIAERAVRWLTLNNPRNPFRPTPQDVFETCEEIARTWRDRIVKFFTSPDPKHAVWRWDDFGIGKHPAAEWGPAPHERGCLVPQHLIEGYLQRYIEQIGVSQNAMLAGLGRARFLRIPEGCFAMGQRDGILAVIAEDEIRVEAAAKHDAYLDTLDPELRRYRAEVLRYRDVSGKTEAEIIVLAKAAMARGQTEAARQEQIALAQRKRMIASAKPEVEAAIKAMHAKEENGSTEGWVDAVTHYVKLLDAEGATPSPEFVAKLRREGVGIQIGGRDIV